MIGFCFTGEGARGAVQAGIVLGLHEKGIDADLTIGISSGSCCAAAYAYGGPQGLADMWLGVKTILNVFRPNWNFLWNRGLMNQRPAEKVVAKLIQNKPVCEGIVCRLNIMTGEMQYVSSKDTTPEEFGEAALGSFAITGLVTDRKGWVDAGSRQMAPLTQAIEAGCDEIYVISGRPLVVPEWKLPGGLLPQLRMGYRALDLSLYELMLRDISTCLRKSGEPGYRGVKIHLVEPKELLYDCVLFRKCRDGVAYGRTEYMFHEETALRLALL